jgi:hypothetical protein
MMHSRRVKRVVLCGVLLAAQVACEPDKAVDVSARPPNGACELTVQPAELDYGMVQVGASDTEAVTLVNHGSSICDVSSIQLSLASDPEFLLAPDQPSQLTVVPGAMATVPVTFFAQSHATPHDRTGKLEVESNDALHPSQSVALKASIDLGCELAIAPDPLNFGNLALNLQQTVQIAMTNQGTRVCTLTNLKLAAGTDVDFTLAPQQITLFTLQPGDSTHVPVTFKAENAPPNLRTGALTFLLTGDLVTVPLQGNIDTQCTAQSELIYTVDNSGMLASFDPNTLTYTNIGLLHCPNPGTPFSMAVDQQAIAWVEYVDGSLLRVDTRDASCTATIFQIGQQGINNFGMGFLFNPNSGVDTLFIAGGSQLQQGATELATISFPGLRVSTIGTVSIGWPELTGTGDGQLWGFVPGEVSSTGIAIIAQIDPGNGKILHSFAYPGITAQGGWAMKFFGGSFWIFLGHSVYEVNRDTAALRLALDGTSPEVVGAGVSTCAPVQAGARTRIR